MRRAISHRRRLSLWAATAALLVASAAGGAGETESEAAASAQEPGTTPVASSDTTDEATPDLRGGLRAFIDPATGLPVVPPPGLRNQSRAPRPRSLRSTSHAGLFEEELAAGGYKVDLQGRFRSVLYARIDADGNVTLDHRSPASDGATEPQEPKEPGDPAEEPSDAP